MGSDLLAQAIDRAVLAPVVGRLLGSERAEIVDWTCETLLGGFITSVRGGGVYRFSGTARIDEVMTPWSVVLKVKVANSLDAAPTDPYYWKRDCLAYQSGLLNDLSGDLVVPRCFGTVERSDDEVWIWLEEVADVHGGEWPASRYGLAARHLGQFSGSYLGGRPLPTYPWLSQQRQRRWVNRNHDKLARYSGVEDHPLVRRSWPGDHAARVLRLWSERELFLDTSDRLPQVFCHLDFFRRNLFARRGGDGREETIVIDWEFAGVGAIGQDASQMAPLSYLFHEYDGSLASLGELVFEGYMAGLQDSGWDGDPRLARLGYAIAGALRSLYPVGVDVVTSPGWRQQVEEQFGCPIEQVLDRWAEMLRLTLDLADEARSLLPLVAAMGAA